MLDRLDMVSEDNTVLVSILSAYESNVFVVIGIGAEFKLAIR